MPTKERVKKVLHGDTFTTGRRKYPVRLSGVNAPETGTRGGAAAKRALEELIGRPGGVDRHRGA